MANKSNVYRDHVIQKQFKDILTPLIGHRNPAKDSSYYKFFIDRLIEETLKLQPKDLRKISYIPSMIEGLWIKTTFPASPSANYKEANTVVEIKGPISYGGKNYSIFAQIIFPLEFQYKQGKLLPVCVFASKDTKELLKSFRVALIKVNGIYYIKIELPHVTEAVDEAQEIYYEVYSENEGFELETPVGAQELIFKSEEILFGAVADHDAVPDTDKIVRSDTIRWLVVTEQDKYDEMVRNGQTKSDELYHVKEEYIENPTLPPTEQPRPNRVSLAVKFNDAYIWTKDYDIDTQVPVTDIVLPPILGYKFKEYRTKPLGQDGSTVVTFPLLLDETKVIYAIYTEVVQLKGIVWENTTQLLVENIQSGDDWDPRSRIPARKNYYAKYFMDNKFKTPAVFPILVVDKNVEIFTQWKKGFYFESKDDFDNRIDDIISDNNGNLGELEFEFADEVDVLDYLFYRKPITHTPKIITSKAKSCIGTFQECSQLIHVSDTVYGNCPNLKNFTDSFKDDTKIVNNVPDLWNRYTGPEIIGTDCFTNCVNTPNRPDIPIPWGGVVWHDVRVLNYVDDTVVKTLRVESGTTYDFMTISETYDSTGVWGAFFEDKQRNNRIYDPIIINSNKDYYAEWCEFDYYFTSLEDFNANIQTISQDANGDLSRYGMGFAPNVNRVLGNTINILGLTKLPKHIWCNINSSNKSGEFGLNWVSDTIDTVPSSYFYFMTRMKQINGFVTTKYTNGSGVLYPTELLKHQKHLNTITNLYNISITDPVKTVMTSVDMPERAIAGEVFRAVVHFADEPVPTEYPGLTTLPADLLTYSTEINAIDGLIIGGRFKTIPTNFFNRVPNLQIAKRLFKNNTALQSMPATLFDPCRTLQDLTESFYGCSNMTGYVPTLWERDPAIPTGTNCFKYCKKTTNFESIPVPWGGEPITTKRVTVTFKTTVAGSKLTGNGVTENATTHIETAIAQLADNTMPIPTNVSAAYGTSEFKGWSTSETDNTVLYQPGDTIVVSGHEVTLYAWYEKTLNITYNANGHGKFGSLASIKDTKKIIPNKDNTVTLTPSTPLTPDAGWLFIQWNTTTTGNGTGYANGTKLTDAGTLSDMTLYAKYSDVRQTVTFNATTNITYNGETSTSISMSLPKPFTVPSGITVANKTVNGHQGAFAFWAASENGSTPGTSAQFKQGSAIPETLSAVNAWYKVPSLTLTLNLNYSGASNTTQQWTDLYTNNDATQAFRITNVPVREYYVFKGWSTSSSGSAVYQSNTDITGALSKFAPNTILYAIWEGEDVTVNYNLNGGTIDGQSTYSVQAKIGDTITIINKTPIKTGYTFTHWEDKLKNRYNAGDQFNVTPDKLN